MNVSFVSGCVLAGVVGPVYCETLSVMIHWNSVAGALHSLYFLVCLLGPFCGLDHLACCVSDSVHWKRGFRFSFLSLFTICYTINNICWNISFMEFSIIIIDSIQQNCIVFVRVFMI